MNDVALLFRPALKPRQTLCRIFGVIVAAGAVGMWFMPHDEANMTGWIIALVVFHLPALLLLFYGFRPLDSDEGIRALQKRPGELVQFYIREVVQHGNVRRRDIMLDFKGGKTEMLPLTYLARSVVDEAAALDLIRRIAPQAQLGKRQPA